MKRLAGLLAVLIAAPVSAAQISASGTQPYSCTVVGASSIPLTSIGQNALVGSAFGSIYQNSDTVYNLSAVTVTGPDVNRSATIEVTSNSLDTASTESFGTSTTINGELSQTTTYQVTISSTDGILTAGTYTASADLTCSAAP